MRSASRSCLSLVLVASLLNIPALSAAEKPLGMIVLANLAYIDKGTAVLGADVFAGDSLKTDPGGTMRVKLGSTQFYLLSSSEASFSRTGRKLQINMTQGTVGFSSPGTDQFEIDTPVATVRPADGQRAFGQVSLTGPQTMQVSVFKGQLVVERNGEERTIRAGEAYNVTYAPDTTPANPSSPVAQPHRIGTASGYGHLIFGLVAIGSMVLVGGLASYNQDMSDSSPSQ